MTREEAKRMISRDRIRHHILKYEKRSPASTRDYSFIDVFQIVENILVGVGFQKDTDYRTISDKKRENILWIAR